MPGLDKSSTEAAEDSSSDRPERQAGLRVRGLPFPLLLCMPYLPGSLTWSSSFKISAERDPRPSPDPREQAIDLRASSPKRLKHAASWFRPSKPDLKGPSIAATSRLPRIAASATGEETDQPFDQALSDGHLGADSFIADRRRVGVIGLRAGTWQLILKSNFGRVAPQRLIGGWCLEEIDFHTLIGSPRHGRAGRELDEGVVADVVFTVVLARVARLFDHVREILPNLNRHDETSL